MAIGIPYVEAINLPLHIALAFLGNMRPSSSQISNKEPEVPPKTSANTHAKTYVSTVRKHSKKSQD
ncbi:hypothetical protein AbA118F_2369 [Acinetobacter baumannii]|nr:hypothetical protein [Acinetobacter baumannii]